MISNWLTDRHFWWYFQCPDIIHQHLLQCDESSDNFTSIKSLEYVALIIHFIRVTDYWTHIVPDLSNLNHVLFKADNTTALVWVSKACKSLLAEQAHGCFQCAVMIINPIRLNTVNECTTNNIFAYWISLFQSKMKPIGGMSSLLQDFLFRHTCKYFSQIPARSLPSWIFWQSQVSSIQYN